MTSPRHIWLELRSSLWLTPTLLTALAAAMAFGALWLDNHVLAGAQGPWLALLFTGGASGARGVLSAIASSIITVTGVVFSITIVVLQLASSQFTPRVLRTFTEDRWNQLVLGVFIGTFTYALIVLRAVRSPGEDYERFVPALAVTLGVALALLSIGFLIFFINHIATAIRVEVIMDRVVRDALEVVDSLFPESLGEPLGKSAAASFEKGSAGAPFEIRSAGAGYLVAVDDARILTLAEEGELVLAMDKAVGQFVLPGETLVRAWPAARCKEETADDIRRTFRLGPERTRHQDVERIILELTDIGVRALSPGTNDPTTAVVCIDRLSEIVVTLGRRRFPDPARVGADGKLRVVARMASFDDLVEAAYAALRHFGAPVPIVAVRLLESLGAVARQLPPDRRGAVVAQLREVARAAGDAATFDADRRRILEAARSALRSLEEPEG